MIVGGGSAGSALANRLSADPTTRCWCSRQDVPTTNGTSSSTCRRLTFPIGSKFYDWKYESEPEPFMNGRKITTLAARCSAARSINGMIFQRGNPLDYERWAADPGMETWDYAHCLPYFKRMENCLAATATKFRGDNGPLVLERGPADNPLFGAFFEAVQQAGYPLTDDVNGFPRRASPGSTATSAAAGGSRRHALPPSGDGARQPRRSRPRARPPCVVRRHQGGRRRVQHPSRRHAAATAGEVILCGGAFNSPQLLQLSGVGNATHLGDLGIPVVHDLPAVGQHMQDHLEVYVQYSCKQPVSLQPQMKMWRRPFIGAEWLFLRKGPGASNHFEGGGFARSNDDVAYPNLMFHFLPIAVRYDGSSPAGGHGYQVHIGPMYSNSRGSVQITSTDPKAKPALRFNYISTPEDRREWVEAIRIARRILNQPAMEPFNGGEVSPGPSVDTDEQILDWVRTDGETALTPVLYVPHGPRRRRQRRRPVDDACARRRWRSRC